LRFLKHDFLIRLHYISSLSQPSSPSSLTSRF